MQQIREYLQNGVDFGFETTMSGVTYLKYFRMLKEKGYKIHIFFLWIPGAQLAIARVRDRVMQGGHSVPVKDIKRRFKRSTEKFFKQYRLLGDTWILFNNSGPRPEIIAKKLNDHIDIIDHDLFANIVKKTGARI